MASDWYSAAVADVSAGYQFLLARINQWLSSLRNRKEGDSTGADAGTVPFDVFLKVMGGLNVGFLASKTVTLTSATTGWEDVNIAHLAGTFACKRINIMNSVDDYVSGESGGTDPGMLAAGQWLILPVVNIEASGVYTAGFSEVRVSSVSSIGVYPDDRVDQNPPWKGRTTTWATAPNAIWYTAAADDALYLDFAINITPLDAGENIKIIVYMLGILLGKAVV